MGTANSTPIPGGGTEGYHILKVIIYFNYQLGTINVNK
jgi:hypothetical protein